MKEREGGCNGNPAGEDDDGNQFKFGGIGRSEGKVLGKLTRSFGIQDMGCSTRLVRKLGTMVGGIKEKGSKQACKTYIQPE